MTINCRVIANAKEISVIKQKDGSYKIRLNVKPVEGKANKKLVEVLARYFNAAKSRVNIIKGETSKNKIVEIEE